MEGVVTIRLDDSKTILLIAAIAGVIAIGALSSGSSSYPGGGGGGGNYHAGRDTPSRTPQEWADHYDRRQQAWGHKIGQLDRLGGVRGGGWL